MSEIDDRCVNRRDLALLDDFFERSELVDFPHGFNPEARAGVVPHRRRDLFERVA